MKRRLIPLAAAAILSLLIAVPALAQAPDFGTMGFTEVVASQQITPGTATTVSGGPFSIDVPADAFTTTVKFEILSAPTSVVQANAPAGQTPILDYALRVTDVASGQLLERWATPATFTATDSRLTADSKYWNWTPTGGYQDNPTGLQATAGKLVHPVNATLVAWVLTVPATTATATATAAATPTATAAAAATPAQSLPQTGGTWGIWLGPILMSAVALILLGGVTRALSRRRQ